ncbi:MFS transporter [Psychrobacter sp. Ps3]|uniref:AmpG family muropeptide MFS transporter n=1 Tax=Psychrobacter sp. Ps3 TaxID=2790957 RepID=UPI001EDFEED4|nr:MFS transporter [Psychrobacter sp. Ps3]MCG3881146.1 MFS transporter [Psychrobacter sp. Ps3]
MSAVKSVPPNQPASKKSWGDALKSFSDIRVMIMLFLGFSAGVPILLVFSSLSLWLSEAGLETGVITMFGWAGLGYSFKFIWAPLIDSMPLPFLTKWLGRRRAWMFVSQLLILLAIFTMASVNPVVENVLWVMALGAVLLGFSSATQDIVIDAYRIELAPPALQPTLSSIYVAGYRIGMIVAGAGALYLATYFGSSETLYNYEAWRNTYYTMMAVMSVGLLTTFAVYEPAAESLAIHKQKRNLKVFSMYAAFLLIPGLIYGLPVFISTFSTRILSRPLTIIPVEFLPTINLYFLIVMACAPFLLIYFILNQPKIINKVNAVAQSRNDNLRILGLFVLSVLAFIGAFVFIGGIFEKPEDVALKFLIEVIRLLGSLAVAILVGYALITVGLAKKEVAKRLWVDPIADFFRRYGKQAILLLLLIGFYRVSDIVAGNLSNVFYAKMGFTKIQIADAVKFLGLFMTIAGGFLGGLIAQKMKMMHVMLIGAIASSSTNLLFILLTYHPGDMNYMYLAVIIDNLAAGFATAVFIAFLSALTSVKFTAVQYAIFSSLMTLFPKVLGGYSGGISDNVGFANFFLITFLIGIPVLILIYLVDKHVVIGSNDDPIEPPVKLN